MIIKCAKCESEATVFFCYSEHTSKWRINLALDVVHHRCAYCHSKYLIDALDHSRRGIHHISKEDYLAALAMAEL